jgi:hypothetical protein
MLKDRKNNLNILQMCRNIFKLYKVYCKIGLSMKPMTHNIYNKSKKTA